MQVNGFLSSCLPAYNSTDYRWVLAEIKHGNSLLQWDQTWFPVKSMSSEAFVKYGGHYEINSMDVQ